MRLELSAKLTQKLSPQILQSMKLLQMTMPELLAYVQEQLQENPVLESGEGSDDVSQMQRRMEQLESLDACPPPPPPSSDDDGPDPLNRYGAVRDDTETLYSHLCAQLEASDAEKCVRAVAVYFAQGLDKNGYLDEDCADVSARLGLPLSKIEAGLALLQSLDPAGVGARSLRECLLLQLRRAEGNCALAIEIVQNHLEDVGRSYYQSIARAQNVSVAEVYAACHQIRALDPRPGSRYGSDAPAVYIRPDLLVTKTETGFEVTMNDNYMPRLGISGYYRRLASETADEAVRDYLSLKIKQAQWVIGGIEQRRTTLLGCAQEIVQRQEMFFRRGRGHLVPMTQSELADILGVHESTVSRTIRGKYLQCCFGIYPLDFFFSRALGDGCGGEVSAESAKECIRALVAGESPKKPLSDQKLTELLAEKGIALSRRTVAKYREELGIPNTAGRRAQGA